MVIIYHYFALYDNPKEMGNGLNYDQLSSHFYDSLISVVLFPTMEVGDEPAFFCVNSWLFLVGVQAFRG